MHNGIICNQSDTGYCRIWQVIDVDEEEKRAEHRPLGYARFYSDKLGGLSIHYLLLHSTRKFFVHSSIWPQIP